MYAYVFVCIFVRNYMSVCFYVCMHACMAIELHICTYYMQVFTSFIVCESVCGRFHIFRGSCTRR